MVNNNQEWFNGEFPKNSKNIEIEYDDFKGELIIEDYLDLEEISISDVDKISKVTLKNLNALEKCLIKDCKLEQLIIENCPKINVLNICKNNLTNLEFIKNLVNLQKLEVDGNEKISSGIEFFPDSLEIFSCKRTELFKVLEFYERDWKDYKRTLLEKGVGEIENNLQELLTIKEKYKKLDEKYKSLKASLQEVLELLNNKSSSKEVLNRLASDPNTREMVANLKKETEDTVKENKKLRIENEDFKPLFVSEEPTVEEKELGVGGYGKVFKGEWKTQSVAVKKPFNIATDADLLKVKAELKLLRNLRSKYTIQYYGEYHDEKSNEFFIIMEYAENGSLSQFVESTKDRLHDWGLNKRLIIEMAKGLVYLHSEGVIHRDLKSPNILLTKENVIKISDFGLAKITSDINKKYDYSKPMVSLRWVAPEVLEGKYSKHSDIYSLGVIIWEVCAKSKPFVGVNEEVAIINRITSGKTNEIPQDVPNELKEIIKNCWKMESNERIGIKEIITELDIKNTKTSSSPSTSKISQEISNSIINERLILGKINEIEKDLEKIKNPLKDELKGLVEKFIEIKKKSLRDEKNKEIRKSSWKLGDELEEKLSEEEVKQIIRYCEELVKLENRLKQQEELQTNIEMSANN